MGFTNKRVTRAICLSAVSYLALALSMPEQVQAQSQTSPLPGVTVDAPRQTARRAPVRRAGAATRRAAPRASPALQPQAPVAYLAPSTSVIGTLPPAVAGGQVGSGTRLGVLGNRSTYDTPFSSTGYTDKLVRDQQAQYTSDVLNNDPSVRSSGGRLQLADQTFIRGFLSGKTDYGFDGFYGITSNTQPALENIERVEVLRGPAALLIGTPPGGSIGGTINLVPKRAGDEPLTRATVGFVSQGELGTHWDVARRFGVNKEWGLRVNGAYRNGEQSINNQEAEFGFASAALDYRGERVRFTADFAYQSLKINAPSASTSVLPGFPVPVAPDLKINPNPLWSYHNHTNLTAASRLEVDITDNLTWFAGVGYGVNGANQFMGGQSQIRNFQGDFTYTPSFSTSEWRSLSADTGLRATFHTGPVKHQAVVSATGFWREFDNVSTNTAAITTLNIYRPTLVARPNTSALSPNPILLNANNNSSISIADAMSVLNDRVTVILGGRYQELQTESYNAAGAVTSAYKATAFSPAAGVVVKPLQNLSLYANYIEGLQAGQFAPTTASNRNEFFPAQVTNQKEVGAKLDLGPVGVTAAFYEITQPISFTDPTTTRFSFDGEQRNRGFEFFVFGAPAPDLRLTGGFALTDGKQVVTPGGQFDGKVAVGVPLVTVNLYGEYDLPPNFLPGVTLTGRAIYTSEQFIDRANLQSIPDWVRFDLGARYTMLGWNNKPIVLRANVENIADKNYWASAARGALGYGRGRTVYLSAQFDF